MLAFACKYCIGLTLLRRGKSKLMQSFGRSMTSFVELVPPASFIVVDFINLAHFAAAAASGNGIRFPFSGPRLLNTRGLYSSSFSMRAEFSNRFNMAAFP